MDKITKGKDFLKSKAPPGLFDVIFNNLISFIPILAFTSLLIKNLHWMTKHKEDLKISGSVKNVNMIYGYTVIYLLVLFIAFVFAIFIPELGRFVFSPFMVLCALILLICHHSIKKAYTSINQSGENVIIPRCILDQAYLASDKENEDDELGDDNEGLSYRESKKILSDAYKYKDTDKCSSIRIKIKERLEDSLGKCRENSKGYMVYLIAGGIIKTYLFLRYFTFKSQTVPFLFPFFSTEFGMLHNLSRLLIFGILFDVYYGKHDSNLYNAFPQKNFVGKYVIENNLWLRIVTFVVIIVFMIPIIFYIPNTLLILLLAVISIWYSFESEILRWNLGFGPIETYSLFNINTENELFPYLRSIGQIGENVSDAKYNQGPIVPSAPTPNTSGLNRNDAEFAQTVQKLINLSKKRKGQ
jgi:hypothetical protein